MSRWSKRGWLLVCCVTVAVLGASTALAAGLHWSIQSGTTTGLHNAQLLGVSCGSARSCFAVGVSAVNSKVSAPVAERWRGSRWAVQRAAVPTGAKSTELFDVSCSSTSRCTATGRYLNSSRVTASLAERWNGKKWAIQRTPNVPGAGHNTLRGISCPSNNWCMAVGANKFPTKGFRILAERWNGRSWSVQKPPNPQTGPFGSELITVSCTSPRACIAVGDSVDNTGHTKGLAERWNGKSWTIQQVPLPSGAFLTQLVGVECAGPSACEAVGYYALSQNGGRLGFSESWNGNTWTMQTVPGPAGAQQTVPVDVSCTSSADCTLVGEVVNKNGTELTLAEKWNGATWQIQPTPNPRGAILSLFNAASCTSATSCVAVGGFDKASGGLPLAERYS
jgi:hypothetical protein